MDRKLLPALQGLGNEVVAVDILGAQRPAAQGAQGLALGLGGDFNEVGNAGTARHSHHIKARADV
jgi:hypothetical protein